MKNNFKNVIMWALIIAPYIYLISIWQQLPAKVPTHFNLQGQADNWSSKNLLFFIPTGLGAIMYFIMLALPYIDPKKKIADMGQKYNLLQFVLTVFFSLLSIYLLSATQAGSIKNPTMLLALIGIMLAIFGNYFQTLRPNYFIGIRTPWTLESETVWKKTHLLGGRLWMAGGIIIALLAFTIGATTALTAIFVGILSIVVIVPVVFSYMLFQKEKHTLN